MSKHRNRSLHGAAPDTSQTALLILDMISDFEFVGGAKLCRAAIPVAKRIARLKSRAAQAGIPAIYVNDNVGRWRSDFAAVLRHCARPESRGAPIARLIAPGPNDYCVLKPKHSGFFATALATLLEYLGARRLILTGSTSDQCVLFTANDAYVRDFELQIPRDCLAGDSPAANRLAFRYFRSVLGADLRPSPRLKLRKG